MFIFSIEKIFNRFTLRIHWWRWCQNVCDSILFLLWWNGGLSMLRKWLCLLSFNWLFSLSMSRWLEFRRYEFCFFVNRLGISYWLLKFFIYHLFFKGLWLWTNVFLFIHYRQKFIPVFVLRLVSFLSQRLWGLWLYLFFSFLCIWFLLIFLLFLSFSLCFDFLFDLFFGFYFNFGLLFYFSFSFRLSFSLCTSTTTCSYLLLKFHRWFFVQVYGLSIIS